MLIIIDTESYTWNIKTHKSITIFYMNIPRIGGYMAKKIRKIKVHHHQHTLEELSQEFLLECERKNLSKQSIKSYESKIDLLLLSFPNQSIETLNNDTLNKQFMDWLKTNRNFSDSSTNITIKNINTFLNYVNKHHQTKLHLEPIKEDTYIILMKKNYENLKEALN